MAGEGRYNRNYMLQASLEAKDNASAAFATVGASAEALEEKLQALEKTYHIAIELDGDKDARAELKGVTKDLNQFERRYSATAGIEMADKDKAAFEKSKENLEGFDGKNYEATAGVDTAKGSADADKFQARIERIRKTKAEAQAGLDVGKALANADRMQAKLDAIKSTIATAHAGVDVDDAKLKVMQTELNAMERARHKIVLTLEEHGLTEAAARVRQLDAMQVDIQFSLDVARAMAQEAAFKSELSTLTGRAYNIEIGVDADMAEITPLKAELTALTARMYKVMVQAETQNFPQAAAEVKALISMAESAKSHIVKIQADADVAGAMGKLGALYLLARKVAQRYKIDIDSSALAGVQSALQGIAGVGSSVSNAFEQMSVSAGRVTQVGNLLQSTMTLVIAALVALAAAAAGPILAALVILGAAIVAVTGGLALLAAAAAPVVAAMMGSAGAAEKNAQAQEGLRNAGVAVESAQRNLAKAQQGVADATSQAAQRVSDASDAYQESLANVAKAEENAGRAREEALKGAEQAIQAYNDSLDSVAQAETAAGRAREEALKGVEAAIQQYNDSLASVADAERSAGDARVAAAERAKQAQESYDQAVKGVTTAEHALDQARNQVTTATQATVRAQEDLNRAMRDEPLNQAEAELGVKDAQLGQAEATQRVAEAQQALNDARNNKDSTSTDISGAELALQRAQLGTEQSSLNAARAQNELSDMRADGSSELQSATQAEQAALQGQQEAYQGVYDAQGNLVDAQGEVVKASDGITKAQTEGARSIEDADRSLAKAREDSNRAYLGIADAQEEGAQRVSDADLSLAKAREQSHRAYLGIADAEEEGARKVQDADEAVSKARADSAKAYEAIGRAQIEGDKQISAARDQVTEAEARLADAQLDYAAKAAKASQETGTLASMIAKLPPALQPLATAFVAAMAPASEVITGLGTKINDVALMALPALGVAAYNMSLQFVTSLDTIAAAWVNNGVLASLQNILNFIPSITGAFTEALGNALGGLINIFSIAMPFVQAFAFWIRDISLRFLEWTNSEGGRQAIFNFLATAAPLASTLGYWVWEIAKAIINWSVEHADAVAAAVDLLGRAIYIVGTYIGPVVGWLLQFAVAHPYVIAIAAGAVAIGAALATLGVIIQGPLAAFGILLSVGGLVVDVLGALGLLTLPALGVAFGVLIGVMALVGVAAVEIIAHWDMITAAASWISTAVPAFFWAIVDFFSGGFMPALAAIGTAIYEMLPLPWRTAVDLILSLWSYLPTGITDVLSGFFSGGWAAIGNTILDLLPAPFRMAAEAILQMMGFFAESSGESGVNAGSGFSEGFLSALEVGVNAASPLFGRLVMDAQSAASSILESISSATSQASTDATTNFTTMADGTSLSMDEIQAKASADFTAAQTDITTQTTAAQTNATTQMDTMQANSGLSMDALLANADANMQGTFGTVDTNLSAANANGSSYLDQMQTSGTGSTGLLNTNANTYMEAANQGISTNLETANTSGTTSLSTLRDTGSAIANEAFLMFTHPFWKSAVEVQNAFNAMIYGVGQIIDAIGLDMTKPEAFTVMDSSQALTGGSGAPHGHAKGGVFRSDGITPMAKGGKLSMQAPTGGMADGQTPRVVYGEAGPEAYVAKNRPKAEQTPYIKQAAAWHGLDIIPKPLAHGGIEGVSSGKKLAASLGATPMYTGGVIDYFSPPDEDWTADVQKLYNYVTSTWPVTGNSYYGHGEQGGSSSGNTVDFWGGGQGSDIDPGIGDQIASWVWNNQSPLGYMIWNGNYYDRTSGEVFGFAEDPHYDHVHVSLTGGWGGGSNGNGGTAMRAKMQQAIAQNLPDSIKASTDGAFAQAGTMDQVVQGTQQKVLDATKDKMMKSVPAGGSGIGLAVGSDLIEMIHSVFPESAWDMAMTVMSRESGGDPSAHNASGASGLFQIMPSTAEGLGGDPSRLFDAAYNITLAGILYAQEGWAPWTETAYAKGGLIRKPHVGMVGEAGPEAVLPLTDKRSMQKVRTGLGLPGGGRNSRGPRGNQMPVIDQNLIQVVQGQSGALGSTAQTSAMQTDQLSSLNATGHDQASSLKGISDQGSAQKTQLQGLKGDSIKGLGKSEETRRHGKRAADRLDGIGMDTKTQTDQLGVLNLQGDTQTGQLDSLGLDSATQTALQGNTDMNTATQTGQLDGITAQGDTQTGQLDGITAQGDTHTGQLDTLNQSASQMASCSCDTGGVTSPTGTTGTTTPSGTSAGGALDSAGNAVANSKVNTQMTSNIKSVKNTGKAQGKGASLNVPGAKNNTTTSGAVPVTDVGTQGHLAKQNARMGQMQLQDRAQSQKITQLQVDNSKQTQELGTLGTEATQQSDELDSLGTETATQTGQLDTLGSATDTQTQEIGALTTETQAGDQQVTTLLTETNALLQQIIDSGLALTGDTINSLAGAIGGAMDGRLAENPATQDALGAANEKMALKRNFGA